MNCQCCGRPLPKPKSIAALSPDSTDQQIYAYYKRIAPASDLAFTRRNASPELQARIDAIVRPTAKDAEAMRSSRRIELADAERASGQPAIGSERWHAEYNAIADAELSIAADVAFYQSLSDRIAPTELESEAA